jgi:glycosyltransferase involved in cell wall biosynthesis
MRLAWFSPLPPVHSGIAAYSLDVLDGLTPMHQVDIYVIDEVWRAAGGHVHAGHGPGFRPQPGPHGLPLYRAVDFPTRHELAPYDLVVYQLGNAACHAYMWPYLLRWPGLVVLHDGALHHARAQALLRDDRADDYRVEFRYNHPGVDPRVADYVVAGLEGSPYYLWPMLRIVMERARGVIVHSERLLEVLREDYPDTPMTHVSMGIGEVMSHDSGFMTGRSNTRRGSLSSPDMKHEASSITFAAFGLITPEKRVPQMLAALAEVRRAVPGVRLRLVGEIAEHYALWKDVARHGVADIVEVTGYVDDEQLDAELLAADVCLCLRWPTAHETSASWLRCLAAGRPTVVTDQLTMVDVPTLEPRHWQLQHTREDAASVLQPPPSTAAVAVAIDMADEAHMLRRAMVRLAEDGALRRQLGEQAYAWWQAHHTIARMRRDYLRALDWAAALPAPGWSADAPAHLRPDPAAFARSLLAPLGVEVDILRPATCDL